ncbi:MAG: DUF4159 domain-containing protein [Bacteroidota bacterium]
MRHIVIISSYLILLLTASGLTAQNTSVKIALAKYGGGGDWYSDPTALPNLIRFCNQELRANIHPEPATVDVGSQEIFNYPFVHLTGHGNVVFSDSDARNLRRYLEAGGFLHVDDNYGIDPYIRREMRKVFPEKDFIELPASYPIFNQKFHFPDGLPKIHEHDNKPPQAFGIFLNDRLVFLYTYETDLGDGWEDPEVHNNPPDVRLKALQMGANIISYVFQQ